MSLSYIGRAISYTSSVDNNKNVPPPGEDVAIPGREVCTTVVSTIILSYYDAAVVIFVIFVLFSKNVHAVE